MASYIYKTCSKCGKYNGTIHKMCSACRKKARKYNKRQIMQEEMVMSGDPYIVPDNGLSANIKDLTDPSPEIKSLQLYFEGKTEINDGSIIQVSQPILNSTGIYRVIGGIKSIVSKITNLTHLSERDVQSLQLHYSDSLIQDLMINWREYGIDEKNRNSIRTSILRNCERIVFPTLMRALKGGERTFWKGSIFDNRNTVVNDKPTGGGFSALNPFKW